MLQACGFGYFSCSLEVFALRYKLLRKLGKGGMGSVWLAERLGLGKNVAIKILDGATSENASGHERFAREAKALAALKSRNIVSILDFGVHNGTPFHVMEVLDGEDLEHRLRRVGRMTPVALAPFVDHVCRGLLRAHSAGLVHRDLKPANIFLAQEEGEEIAKLIDFGIVKVMGKDGKNVTQTGDVIGTPLYMSPEQVRGNRDVDHRSDLWSLGVTVFRALTGRLPFDGQTSGDILVRICTDPVPNIRALNPNLPPEAEGFIERALAREPHDRFQTAEDFANAFQSVAKAQSSHSGPQSSRRTPIVSVPPVAIGDSGAKSRSGASISSAASSSRRALTGIDAAPVSGRLSASGARLRPETYDSRGATSNPSERNLVPWFAAIFVVMAGGLFFFGYLAWQRNRQPTTTGVGTVVYAPVYAECLNPLKPDPRGCDDRNTLTVDTEFVPSGVVTSVSLGPRAAYFRFDLDQQLVGRVIESAFLELNVGAFPEADSTQTGELWEVEPFDPSTTSVRSPARVGANLAPSYGPAAPGSTVQLQIPPTKIRPNSSLYLGVLPSSSDGVDYYDNSGLKPPTLVVRFR